MEVASCSRRARSSRISAGDFVRVDGRVLQKPEDSKEFGPHTTLTVCKSNELVTWRPVARDEWDLNGSGFVVLEWMLLD